MTTDLSKFTLKPSEENHEPKMATQLQPEKENHFWNTLDGKLWIMFFGLAIVISLAAGLFIYTEGTTHPVSEQMYDSKPQKVTSSQENKSTFQELK